MSAGSGWIVNALAALLAAVFWRAMRGRSLQDMFDAASRDHHKVLKVLKKHPGGGAWREFQTWMGDRRK